MAKAINYKCDNIVMNEPVPTGYSFMAYYLVYGETSEENDTINGQGGRSANCVFLGTESANAIRNIISNAIYQDALSVGITLVAGDIVVCAFQNGIF